MNEARWRRATPHVGRSACAAGAILAAACTSGGESNDALARRSSTCAECVLDRRVVWTSAPRDPNVRRSGIFIERSGHLWAMGGYSDETIVRFDLERSTSSAWTRRGDGPGEFSDQVSGGALHVSADTLVIAQDDRIQYFTAGLEFARSFRVPVRVRGSMIATGPTTFVVSNTLAPSASLAAGTLHAFDDRGTQLASWRPADSLAAGAFVPLTIGPESGTVWAAYPSTTGSVLELWSVTDPSLRHRMNLSVDWWYVPPLRGREAEAALRGRRRPELLRPASGVTGLHDDGSTLWVAVRHADESWADAQAQEEPMLDGRFDSFVLALDRVDGRVLAAEVLDGFAFGFTNQGRLVVYGVDPDGHPFLRLESVALRR